MLVPFNFSSCCPASYFIHPTYLPNSLVPYVCSHPACLTSLSHSLHFVIIYLFVFTEYVNIGFITAFCILSLRRLLRLKHPAITSQTSDSSLQQFARITARCFISITCPTSLPLNRLGRYCRTLRLLYLVPYLL